MFERACKFLVLTIFSIPVIFSSRFAMCQSPDAKPSSRAQIGHVEAGDLKVDYTVLRRVKNWEVAQKSCTQFAPKGSWHLPSGVHFFALLMTAHDPFLTLPQIDGE